MKNQNQETTTLIPLGQGLWAELDWETDRDADGLDRRRAERDGWEGQMWWDGR